MGGLKHEEKQIIIMRTLIYDKNDFRPGTPKSDTSGYKNWWFTFTRYKE
jgi:hypothetical protein